MELDSPNLDIFVPDNLRLRDALARTTHMGIGAHADDLEIMAFPGIAACHADSTQWFSGVVVSDGAGSPRIGDYATLSAKDLIARRQQEQRDAASLGKYSVQLQLGYNSALVKSSRHNTLLTDLVAILETCRPRVLYLHNPADAHDTHRATVAVCVEALRQLPAEALPEEIYGVEVWRSLDWLPPELRVALPIEDPDGLQAQLLRCHDSQVSAGKAYDKAIINRQQANATLVESHGVDRCSSCVLAINLRPMLKNKDLNLESLLRRCLQEFSDSLLPQG